MKLSKADLLNRVLVVAGGILSMAAVLKVLILADASTASINVLGLNIPLIMLLPAILIPLTYGVYYRSFVASSAMTMHTTPYSLRLLLAFIIGELAVLLVFVFSSSNPTFLGFTLSLCVLAGLVMLGIQVLSTIVGYRLASGLAIKRTK